jgi:glycine reductase
LSSTHADLAIATFAIDEIVEGTQTGRDGTTLIVSPPQLAVGAGEPALAEATVEVVRPGDRVRISNVCDAVVPDVRADDPARTFPGLSGTAGEGDQAPLIHRLDGVHVLTSCDWGSAGYVGPDELPPSIVDMSGPGADRSPFGATSNVVLRCVPAPGAPVEEADAAMRRAGATLARDLASATLGQTADRITHPLALDDADPSLPAVCVIVQVASEGPLTDSFFDGEHLRDLRPRVIEPAACYEGRLTNGAYDWPGVRNVTAHYQDPAVVRALTAEHGRTLRFVGVILAPGYLDTAAAKRASAEASATLAAAMGATGAVCTTFSSGNSHTDTMLTVRALERQGIGTVALVCETNGGLTDHVDEADCLISTGNEDELVDPWTPERAIGGEDGAQIGVATPTVSYLGSCTQLGNERWTAVPA